jgi:uncharacterized lipoprotein YmbA
MKNVFSFKRTIIILAIILLSSQGCISVPRSPSPSFYTLQPVKESEDNIKPTATNLDNVVIGIGPLSLPDYFNRPQIVTRNSDDTISFAEFHRWAEPLDRAMCRTIAQNLSVLLAKTNVEIFPWNGAIPIKYQVIGEVIELDYRLGKEAQMFVQWSILDSQEKKILFTKRSEYRRPIATSNYSDLVQAMSFILGQASAEIVQVLSELTVNSPEQP